MLYGQVKCTKTVIHEPKGKQICGFLLPAISPCFFLNIQCNEVWHQCTLKDRLQRQRQKATVFYEPGLELKSALIPLTVIHQPRFTLTLLLCKCLYRISCPGWGEGVASHSNETGLSSAESRFSTLDKHTPKCGEYCSLLFVSTTNEFATSKVHSNCTNTVT